MLVEPVIVVGAGMSGIAVARTINAAGRPVVVMDRGRRIGGRMAVHTVNERPVDIGASYFTVSDPSFESVVHDWQQRSLARPWTDTFHLRDAEGLSTKTGPMRWAANRGLRSLVEDLAKGLDVRSQTVRQVAPGPLVDDVSAAAVVLAMPDPQARRLLHPCFGTELDVLTDPFEPVVVLTATWGRRCWTDGLDGLFVTHDDAISWVADDGRRRGDLAPILVAHSTPSLAENHLSSPQNAARPMMESLRRVLEISEAASASYVHRWTFAKPAKTRTEPYFLGESMVGLCGDAWSERPRVESAYLSGTALGQAVLDRLG